MVTVLEEKPYAAAVNDDKLNKACSNCFARKTEILMDKMHKKIKLDECSKCKTVYYCSKRCQVDDWKFHKDECNYFVSSKYCPSIDVRMLSRIFMRIKIEDFPVAFNGLTFNDLSDYTHDLNNDWNYYKSAQSAYDELTKFMGAENVPPQKEVISVYAKYFMHVQKILDDTCGFEDLGRGIYVGLSMLKHSCRPDCEYLSLKSKAILLAKDPETEYNNDLTISFCKLLLPKQFRQRDLYSRYRFICECQRCSDDDEDLLERSARSTCCPDGVVLPRDDEQPLICSICKKESPLTAKQINDANIRLEMYCAQSSRESLEKNTIFAEMDDIVRLFEEMEQFLSPYNLYFVTMAETLKRISLRCYLEYKNAQDITTEGLKEEILRFCLDDSTKFHKAQEKAVERYIPFGLEKVMYALDGTIIERHEAHCAEKASREQIKKVFEAFRNLYLLSKSNCGVNYPFTQKTLGESRNLIKIEKSIETEGLEFIKKVIDSYL